MATMVVPTSAPHVASLRSSSSHGRRRQDGSRRAASVALLSAATTSNCSSLASSLQETRGVSSSSSKLRWLQGREGKQLQEKLQNKRNPAIKELQRQSSRTQLLLLQCEAHRSSRWKQMGWLRNSAVPSSLGAFSSIRTHPSKRPNSPRKAGLRAAASLQKNGGTISALLDTRSDEEWDTLGSDIAYLTRSARLVQWYPGHIAKAERLLKEQLKLMDVVIEVRDARIPIATTHPEIDTWIGDRMRILVLNREDMISSSDKNAWTHYYIKQGIHPVFTDGRRGAGSMKLARMAKSVAVDINVKRKAKGLLPRNVRAAVVGYPNVGKSSIINRLLKRKMCETAPRPGVTKSLKWARVADGLDLLDAPGVLPMQILDQAGATRLAICNDIGENSYAVAGVAAVLVEMIKRMPTAGPGVLEMRYKMSVGDMTGEAFLEELAQLLFQGDVNQAAYRVLRDYRVGKFGWIALERPPS
ncbi:hypothetical protein CY35_02G070100 [Sphagnum magellanicum]|nr:hypothetical protein CY35_02G070100 [Sphagnum magellanicum]